MAFWSDARSPHDWLKPVLRKTRPPEIDDDLQNHFLAGILAPMRDVVLQFLLHKTKTTKTVGGRAASPERASPASGGSPNLRT